MASGLNEFQSNYIDPCPERVVLDLDMDTFDGEHSPFIIIRHAGRVMVLNPQTPDSTNYLDVDVHSFSQGQDASCGVFGMSQGRPRVSFNEDEAGQTSNGWPSSDLVVLLLGEEKIIKPAINPVTGKEITR